MTRICLIRHGETDWNTARRLQGHIDTPLNATGQRQAQATAALLAGHGFQALYTSDLLRARQTAAAAGTACGLQPQPEPRLRERHYGLFQGLTYDEAAVRHPEEYRRFHARDPHYAFAGGGESLTAFARRIGAALEDLARRHAGTAILVVTHGGVLDIAHRLASRRPLASPRDFPIPNAALNWLEFTEAGWQVLEWARQEHLQGARDELPNA